MVETSCHQVSVQRGREPPDAMSLHYADTSLPDLLGRSSLNYADQASAMQTVPLLCRPSLCYAVKEPLLFSTAFFKSWFFMCIKY